MRKFIRDYVRVLRKGFPGFPDDLVHAFGLKKNMPKVVYVEPTNFCNARCVFCAYKYYDAKKGNMSEYVLRRVVEDISFDDVAVNTTPFAGEVLLDKNYLIKISMLRDVVKNISTYTNLIFLDRFDVADFLCSGLTKISISAGPLERKKYEEVMGVKVYDRFLRNLHNLLVTYQNIKNDSNCTVSSISLEFRGGYSIDKCLSLKDYQDYVAPYVNKNICLSAMTSYDSWMGLITEKDMLDGMNLLQSPTMTLMPCSRLKNLQVLVNGDIRACGCRYDNNLSHDDFFIGNISDMTIFEAYNSDKMRQLKKKFLLGNPPVSCKKCLWYMR